MHKLLWLSMSLGLPAGNQSICLTDAPLAMPYWMPGTDSAFWKIPEYRKTGFYKNIRLEVVPPCIMKFFIQGKCTGLSMSAFEAISLIEMESLGKAPWKIK